MNLLRRKNIVPNTPKFNTQRKFKWNFFFLKKTPNKRGRNAVSRIFSFLGGGGGGEEWFWSEYLPMLLYKCFYNVWINWVLAFKRWVKAYRKNRLLVNCSTNNGFEHQNNTLKHCYLHVHKTNSLTGMLTVLVEDLLPDKYERYTLVTACTVTATHYI